MLRQRAVEAGNKNDSEKAPGRYAKMHSTTSSSTFSAKRLLMLEVFFEREHGCIDTKRAYAAGPHNEIMHLS
eukprot:1989651-Rhodomonas_salina.1